MRIGTDSKHRVMRFLEKQFKHFAKKFWLPANAAVCVCACVLQQASGYACVQWVWCVCCSHFLSSHPLTKSFFTPQSIWDGCCSTGVSPLALVHLDHVFRVQQSDTDVKQNKWFKWQWSIENKINDAMRTNQPLYVLPISRCSKLQPLTYFYTCQFFVWGI